MYTNEDDARKARVLVLYASPRWTHPVVEALVDELVHDGLVVEVGEASSHSRPPPPADYDAIVIGSPLRFGMLARPVIEYIEQHIDELEQMPAFLFTVGGEVNVARLAARQTGWVPTCGRAMTRPAWQVRWFGDPNAERAQAVHEFAIEIAASRSTDAKPASTASASSG